VGVLHDVQSHPLRQQFRGVLSACFIAGVTLDDTDAGDTCRAAADSDSQPCRWSLGSNAGENQLIHSNQVQQYAVRLRSVRYRPILPNAFAPTLHGKFAITQSWKILLHFKVSQSVKEI